MRITTPYQRMIQRAKAQLPARARYALRVLDGDQIWSGADLRGKAKLWGAAYALQRERAQRALQRAGGELVYDSDSNGKCIAALPIARDADGETVAWQTSQGYSVMRSRDGQYIRVTQAQALRFEQGQLVEFA